MTLRDFLISCVVVAWGALFAIGAAALFVDVVKELTK